MARRAKLRIVFHKRLQEGRLVRLGLQVGEEVIHLLDPWVLARRQFMQWRIFNCETSVAHGAVDVHDRMAGYASQAVLRFRCIDLVFDRLVETAIEEHGMIVASRAPLRALGARYVLHVLDGFAIVLIVERSKVMHRGVPLFVDVLVTLSAALRIHKEIGWDRAANIGLGGRGPEGRLRSAAFFLHRRGNVQSRITDHRAVRGPHAVAG